MPLRTTGINPPLFCVHPAGGVGTVYSNLAHALGAHQPVWALQARGLEADEEPHPSIVAMAEAYVAAIREVQPAGPYHLLGWSLGGTVAQEMAVRLEANGETIGVLALLDTPGKRSAKIPNEPRDMDEVLRNLAEDAGVDPQRIPTEHYDRLIFARDHMVEEGLIPPSTPTDWVERVMLQLMASSSRFLGHVTNRCRSPILLFRAMLDPVPEDQDPEAFDWGPYTQGSVTVAPVMAKHSRIVDPGPSAEIANVLTAHLTKLTIQSSNG